MRATSAGAPFRPRGMTLAAHESDSPAPGLQAAQKSDSPAPDLQAAQKSDSAAEPEREAV